MFGLPTDSLTFPAVELRGFLLAVALAMIALSAVAPQGHDIRDLDDESSLLQLAATIEKSVADGIPLNTLSQIKIGIDSANNRLPGECGPGYRAEDFERPIREVLLEHPDVDGYCYFGWMGNWMRRCAVARKAHDYFLFAKFYDEHTSEIQNSNSTPVTIRYEGGNFTTLDHMHPVDDAICAANGYWDYPVDKVLHDFDYATDVSREYCKRLEEKVPNFYNLTMSDFMKEEIGDDLTLLAQMSFGGEKSSVNSALKPNMLLHEAVKCLLGGVECDIANCARRGCKDANNVVKYGSDCK